MALSYNLGYQESISVHPTRRQNFAGKVYSNFPNIWEWLISIFGPSSPVHLRNIFRWGKSTRSLTNRSPRTSQAYRVQWGKDMWTNWLGHRQLLLTLDTTLTFLLLLWTEIVCGYCIWRITTPNALLRTRETTSTTRGKKISLWSTSSLARRLSWVEFI